MEILILGAGPTGLGAAWRLNELSHDHWTVFERAPRVGGLSSSFLDEKGYTWDVGGHVLFSHYDYFDDVLGRIIPADGWLSHERESWIRIQDRWVPYPFQMNVRHLQPETFLECVRGLLELPKDAGDCTAANFAEWLRVSFGAGLARVFMRPYNWKVWGYPLEHLSVRWVGERVATVDLGRIIENYVYKRDDISWGPNQRFRFPRLGGTGAIWKHLTAKLPQERIVLHEEAVRVDLDRRKVYFQSGRTESYDFLLSTVPLTTLCTMGNVIGKFPGIDDLGVSSTHVVGVGITGRPSAEMQAKCWMYFPEENCPFYRVTHFSHYSPNNVPDIDHYWSLMAEVSETKHKPVDSDKVVEDVIRGLVRVGLVDELSVVHNTWYRRFSNTYPVPTIGRDEVIEPASEYLETQGVYSRGRMGAWKYEVGNMDHSFMQGKEWVDKILLGDEEITLNRPYVVNRLSS